MPPKQKFTKEEIISASLQIVRREGIAGLTARALGSELGTSSRPIFTAFQNMEEVLTETIKAARVLYDTYVEKGLSETPAFKGVGMSYIHFAKEEPRLFALLFMTQSGMTFKLDNILPAIDLNSEKILSSIMTGYGLSKKLAKKLYTSMWIFTHGIACLCATGMSNPSENETNALLTEAFSGLLMKWKSGEQK
jgi:AcrR family transcriptional regulator